jgi:hypothetical protein
MRASTLRHLAYFDSRDTDKYQEVFNKQATFGAMGEWPEGEVIPSDSPIDEGNYTMTQTGYGLGFAVGRHMVRYDLVGDVQAWADALADSAIQTLRAKHASVLNNAFSTSYTYRESGVALVSASHTTAGGTRSNILAAATALSFASYDALMQVAGAHVDYRGKLNPLSPDQLIAPDELRVTATQIKGSQKEPGTTDNDVNPFFGDGPIVIEEHLTSATAWFIRDTSMQNMVSRTGLSFRTDKYVDQPTQSLVHYGEMDFAYGAKNWEGLLGSAGA